MDAGTLGLLGGVVGTVAACLGAWIGARASYRAAVNEAQRQFYRRLFAWLVPMGAASIVAIWLIAAKVLRFWLYFVVMAAWFVPLGPAIARTNRRLAALRRQPIQDRRVGRNPAGGRSTADGLSLHIGRGMKRDRCCTSTT